ncbi:hypothetical protein Tco_1214854 [Tanacetum coccineum]
MMNPEETLQAATHDEKWVPSPKRVKISSTNIRLETIVPQKEETFQGFIDIIKNMCFKAFTISADVLEIFMQQFWYTIKKLPTTDSYEFLLANKKCIVNVEVFRTILDIFPRVEGVDFATVRDDDIALTFLIDLGYKYPLNRHTNIFGTFNKENVNYPELIWEDFAYQIDHRKEKRSRREDYQEYGHPIPDVILTDAIKRSKSYKMFIKYSINQIPPKKSRGKGSKGKKTTKESQETVDVSKESKPEPEPPKKKTASRRVVKKKVTLSADDNIIFDDHDAALELAKSISQTEAEEAGKVHATHARIVTESIPESGKKKTGGRIPKSIVIQDTPSGLKSKPATSKTKLKGAPSLTLVEQEAANIMQALKEIISATSSEGTGAKLGVPDEDKDTTEEKDEKDGDADDKGDDHISDTQDTNDEDVETESDEDDIYKYKIHVRKDEDEEMKDAKVEGSNKGDEEITDAIKEEAEKTSEAKDDTKKTKLPPLSSSLSVSSSFGDQFLKLSFDSSLVDTVKDSAYAVVSSLLDIPIQQETPQIQSLLVQKIPVSVILETINLPPIPEIVTETPVITTDPSPQATPIILILKTGDHSSVALVVLQYYVPTVVDSYLDTKVGDHLPELTKKPTPITEQESKKIPSKILKIKKKQAESQKNLQFTIKSTDKAALEE